MLAGLTLIGLCAGVLVYGQTSAAQDESQAGIELFRAGHIGQAMPILAHALHSRSESPGALYYLIRGYRIARQNSLASDAAEQLLRRFPNSPYTHKLLGEALDAQYQEQQAEREFRAALETSPDLPELHFSLGMILWRRHDDAGAAAEFTRETNISPNFPRSAVYLADIALRSGRPEAALQYLKTALNLDPNQYDALCLMAKCREALHQDNDAILALELAVKLDPQNSTAHYRLSRLYAKAGRTEEAAHERMLTLEHADSARFAQVAP